MLYRTAATIICTITFFACTTNSDSSKTNPVIVNVSEKSQTDSSANNVTGKQYKYELNKPVHTWKLPEQLVEVSGNTWIDDNHLILIEDINPVLYLIKLDDKNAALEKTITFKEEDKDKFDIEDVTIVNDVVYALWSHGTLFKISDWRNKPQVDEIKTFLKKENNTEGLCYDPVTKKLLIACKDDSNVPDEKKSTRAVYDFDIANNTLSDQPFFLIHKKDFEKVADEKLEFNPSAIAVHPVTHDIYLLSTRDNKCMAVYSHDGKLKDFQFIDKDLMPQPEGMCFSPDGKLYISSEGKKGDPGNLFEFDPLAGK
ncbi:MAG TPA: SdiA-regulated domain-containing protein [Chitinophagaceae bacterium]|nr:SdiA-regulated domain-containing protein [Chitinophagaceae bacterium]